MIKGQLSAGANCRSKVITPIFCGVAGLSGNALAQNSVAPTDARGPAAHAGSEVSDSGQPAIGDIVVTPQRREQVMSEVPLAVQATTGVRFRSAGIKEPWAFGRAPRFDVILSGGTHG